MLSLRTVAGRDEKTTAALCADAHEFSLHAGVRCGAHQRKELERLCRYITRPAIANERQLWRKSTVGNGSNAAARLMGYRRDTWRAPISASGSPLLDVVTINVDPWDHDRQQDHTGDNGVEVFGEGRREPSRRPLRQPESDQPDRFPHELEHQQWKHLQWITEADECEQSHGAEQARDHAPRHRLMIQNDRHDCRAHPTTSKR